MRRTFALMTAALVLKFVSCSAAAQSREVNECEHQMNERGAAMAARDWVSMEKFANVFIKKCQRAATSIDIWKAYWESSVAAEQLGRPAAALKYIDGCISVAYSNGTCHVQKVLVLKGMKRTEEARRLIAPTSKLLASQLEDAKKALEHSTIGGETERLKMDLESLEVATEHVKLLATQLGVEI